MGQVGSQVIKSAGRPIRSIRGNVGPGQFLSPNDVPIGKKMYPVEVTVGKVIPEEVVQA